MPTNYTPTSTDHATITLPADGELASAESNNISNRQLGDITKFIRTDFLRAIPLLAADVPFISSPNTANDQPGNSSNKWKLCFSFECNDGRKARFYIGDGGNGDCWILTFNAVWDPDSDQLWTSDNNTSAASALWCRTEEIRWYGKAVGASPWATAAWDAARGTLRVGDSVFVGNDLSVGDDLTVGDDANVTGDVGVGGNVQIDGLAHADDTFNADNGFNTPGSTGDYNYAPIKLDTTPIPLAGSTNTTRNGTGTGYTASGIGAVPLRLPLGSTGGTLNVAWFQNTSTPAVFKVLKRSVNFATPGAPVLTQIGSTLTGPASSGFKRDDIDISGETVNDPEAVYELEFDPGDTLDELQGLQMVDWQNPGPRNSL